MDVRATGSGGSVGLDPVTADVVVVGGGPAGATAALHLARAGAAVTIVDRAAFPRDKACGDALVLGALRALHDEGLGDVADEALALGGARHRPGVADGAPGVVDAGATVATLPRRRLDERLVRAAVAAGARLVRGRVVRVERRRHGAEVVARLPAGDAVALTARVVVGADGAGSAVAHAVGLHPGRTAEQAVSARGYLRLDDGAWDPLLEIAPVPPLPGGGPAFAWVLPIDATVANVGVYRCGVGAGRHLRRDVVAIGPSLAPAGTGARWLGPVRAGVVRYDFDPTRVVAGPVVLVGDAAGLASATSGEGISYALISGRLAAEAAAAELDGVGGLAGYAEAVDEQLGGHLRAERHRVGEGGSAADTGADPLAAPAVPVLGAAAWARRATVGRSAPPLALTDGPEALDRALPGRWLVVCRQGGGPAGGCDSALRSVADQWAGLDELGADVVAVATGGEGAAARVARAVRAPFPVHHLLGALRVDGAQDADTFAYVVDDGGTVRAVVVDDGADLFGEQVVSTVESLVSAPAPRSPTATPPGR